MSSRATAHADSQPSLFTEGQQHSGPSKRKRDRRRVLAWFAGHTGTAHECAVGLGALPTTVLPRVTELRKAGCLTVIPGLPRRATGFGGTAAVLIITMAGRKELRS